MMLDLEDAVMVAKRLMEAYGGDVTEETEELIRNELEQKCYVNTMEKRLKPIEDMLNQIMEITPENIAGAISKDHLREYCKELQVALNMLFIQIPINWPGMR